MPRGSAASGDTGLQVPVLQPKHFVVHAPLQQVPSMQSVLEQETHMPCSAVMQSLLAQLEPLPLRARHRPFESQYSAPAQSELFVHPPTGGQVPVAHTLSPRQIRQGEEAHCELALQPVPGSSSTWHRCAKLQKCPLGQLPSVVQLCTVQTPPLQMPPA